jgi:hypothetical protein
VNINDITKQIAQKYSGLSIEKKPEPAPVVTTQPVRLPRDTSIVPAPRIWPSERMGAGLMDSSTVAPVPKRGAVMMFTFPDDELAEMLATPARRGWEFKDWLEVIGLPRDLHPKLDGVMYSYCARAFLDRKKEAHQR